MILNHADECGCIGSDNNLIVYLVKGKYNSNFQRYYLQDIDGYWQENSLLQCS